MAKPRSPRGGSGEPGKTSADSWTKLTWDELERWAGSGAVSRGRTYRRGGRVRDLAISAGGDLLATVSGTGRYATTVSLTRSGGKVTLESSCTCPVGFACKHAVATVAEYLQAIADGRAVPIASEDDPRRIEIEAERADDPREGEIAAGFAGCVSVIFQAAIRSSLSPAGRLLFAIETEMADDIDAIGEAAGVIFDASYEPKDWSEVADVLAARLEGPTAGGAERDDFSRNYRRDRFTSWIGEALGEAGREGEIGALYESEARTTGSYERLVNGLIEARRFEDAERRAKEGIAATIGKYPGISNNLASKLAEIAGGRKQWDVVAAHAATQFFDQPGPSSFDELIKAARKARVEAGVREAALRFLETGIGPIHPATAPKPATPRRRSTPTGPCPSPTNLFRSRAGEIPTTRDLDPALMSCS